MKIREILRESTFSPNEVYLHGGPKALTTGHFKRYGRDGMDSGALFFIKESPTGWRYAVGYAMTKPDGGVYRCRIKLTPDQVFDFANPQHRCLARTNLSPEEFKSWNDASRNGHLDWTSIDDELMGEWGFKGAVLFERPAGINGYDEDAVSVGVFDPADVEILGFTPKEEVLQKYPFPVPGQN